MRDLQLAQLIALAGLEMEKFGFRGADFLDDTCLSFYSFHAKTFASGVFFKPV